MSVFQSSFLVSNKLIIALEIVQRLYYECTFRNISDKIAFLDREEAELVHQLAHIRAKKQHKLTGLSMLKHANSPISRLPVELLAFIFELTVKLKWPDAPLKLSHVNRSWREIAIHSPFLWRNIRLKAKAYPEKIEAYLIRSQPLSIAVTVNYEGGRPSKNRGFMIGLSKILSATTVSRWQSFHATAGSTITLKVVLGLLGGGLSAPHLTEFSVRLREQDWSVNMHGHSTIFDGGAPSLHTVRLCGLTFSNWFPSAALVELELDCNIFTVEMLNPSVFVVMPNLRVLTLKGPFRFSMDSEDSPIVVLPLERLTCESAVVLSLFTCIAMPDLRYLLITTGSSGSIYHAFLSDAIDRCRRIPIFPSLEEIHYTNHATYDADSIFIGLPSVSVVEFPYFSNSEDGALCSAFFKALIDDTSRWPYLTTLIFNELPDEAYESLQEFVLMCSSENRRVTIRVKHHHFWRWYDKTANAELASWLQQQHVKLEVLQYKPDLQLVSSSKRGY